MPEFFGPYLPGEYFPAVYFGETGESGGATYANGAATIAGAASVTASGITTRRDVPQQDSLFGWRRISWPGFKRQPLVTDADAVCVGRARVAARISGVAQGGAASVARATATITGTATIREDYTADDNDFWLMAA